MSTNNQSESKASTGRDATWRFCVSSACRVAKRTFWRICFFAVSLAVCGCAGIHPYNQARDTSARQIQTNFNKIDLTSFIDKARTNLDVLRQEQLSASQQSLLTEGDFRILSMLESSLSLSEALNKQMIDRLKGLTGKLAPPNFQDVSNNYGILLTNNYLVENQYVDDIDEAVSEIIYIAQKAPPPFDWQNLPSNPLPTKWTNGLSESQLVNVQYAYNTLYIVSCSNALRSLTNLTSAFPTGGPDSIHQALRDWQRAISNLTVAKGNAAAAAAALNKLVDEYTKKAQTNSVFWKNDHTNAIKDLANAVGKLETMNVLGADAAVKVKMDAVDILLQAAASGQFNQTPTNDTLRAAVVCASIPQLARDVQAAVNAFHAPSLSSLLIQKDLLSAERDFTARQAARLQAKADLSFQEIVLKLDELNDYCVILRLTDHSMGVGETNTNSPFRYPMTHFFTTSPTDADYRDVIESFTSYAIAWRGPRMQQEAIRSQLNDLEFQTALDADEVALRCWSALLSTPINQLVAYYGTGFKPSEVADFVVKLLGVGDLAAIAARIK